MRRPGLLLASAILACGAGLALSTPASAAPRSDGPHWCDNYGAYDYYYHHGHRYYGHGYHHHHGGLAIGINIGIGIGIGH